MKVPIGEDIARQAPAGGVEDALRACVDAIWRRALRNDIDCLETATLRRAVEIIAQAQIAIQNLPGDVARAG